MSSADTRSLTHKVSVKVFGSPFLDTLTTRCSHIQHKDHIKDFKSYQSGTSIFIEILKTKSILRNSWQELTWQYVLHWYSKWRSTRNWRHTLNTAWTQVQGSCGRALIQRFRHYRPSAETNGGKTFPDESGFSKTDKAVGYLSNWLPTGIRQLASSEGATNAGQHRLLNCFCPQHGCGHCGLLTTLRVKATRAAFDYFRLHVQWGVQCI